MHSLFTTKTDLVARGALDGLATRHRVYANNIANVETPGFQPSEVSFEDQLRQVRDDLARHPERQARAAERSGPVVVPANQDPSRTDGNHVQADQQIVRLVENSLQYEALTRATRMRDALLRTIVTEGRR